MQEYSLIHKRSRALTSYPFLGSGGDMEERKRRHSIRLPGFDYASAGAYFVTICTHKKAHLFGEICNGTMQCNDVGNVVQDIWNEIPVHFPGIEIDEFCMMPNHVHGVIWILDRVGAQFIAPRMSQTAGQGVMNHAPTLGTIIRAFKAKTSFIVRNTGRSWFSWQRNYYERIIRNDEELDRIRRYILDNPRRWFDDPENP